MLEVKNVGKRFGGLQAVDNVSFQVNPGELVAVFGPNGSGKTTLLNLLSGTLQPTAGDVLWQGASLVGRRASDVAAAGVVKTFQNPQLFPELTVQEHLRIAGHLGLKRLHGLGRWSVRGLLRAEGGLSEMVAECAERCHLSGALQQPARDLSYGQEKMLGVAMALVCEPRVLLLDEPASGLGKAEIENLTRLLDQLRADGLAICVIDHRIAFLSQVADKAIAMQYGRLIAHGRPQDVLQSPDVVRAYLGVSHAAA
ncbi:MAG: ABC transporter ATP-binding protein [Pseudomonadota bacterium]